MENDGAPECPDAASLWHMWCEVLSGRITRREGAEWAEQWAEWTHAECEEWQESALEAFTFAALPADVDGHFLYSDEDLLSWNDDCFPAGRFPR